MPAATARPASTQVRVEHIGLMVEAVEQHGKVPEATCSPWPGGVRRAEAPRPRPGAADRGLLARARDALGGNSD